MNFREEIRQTVSDLNVTLRYMKDRYGSNQRYWWAVAHRAQLISSGKYIYTTRPSERTMRRTKTGIGNFIVGEAGPELINFRHSTP